MTDVSSLTAKFRALGLSESQAKEYVKNKNLSNNLSALIDELRLAEPNIIVEGTSNTSRFDQKQAGLISSLASSGSDITTSEKIYVVEAIEKRKLGSTDQVSAAIDFLRKNPLPLDEQAFNVACGIGFTITNEEISASVKAHLSGLADDLERGWANFSAVLAKLRLTPELRWASPLSVKDATEKAFSELFGPRLAGAVKLKPKKATGTSASSSATTKASTSTINGSPPEGNNHFFIASPLSRVHLPGQNPQPDPGLSALHLKQTGGTVRTRFPPEPNGYLHVGHTKAMEIDFGYASWKGGRCILRYDDTNPLGEQPEYYRYILEIVRWLGHEPWRITCTSGYFDRLWRHAIELVNRGAAYTCRCTGDEIKANRGLKGGPRKTCVHRDQPIEKTLKELLEMREGKHNESDIVLRMKMDILGNPNPQMWDLVAYRVVKASHVRTGNKWCVYPSYDFAHCLIDSYENITHSLCTLEFTNSRESYDWLLHTLKVYMPRQYETPRLSLQGAVMSKRLIRFLVQRHLVSGWDDPRLFTMIALRRRGIPPDALRAFVREVGIGAAGDSVVSVSRFESVIRNVLEGSVGRAGVVLEPLKIVIQNLPETHLELVKRPIHPKDKTFGEAEIPFTNIVYIERSDFRENMNEKGEDGEGEYFRLAPNRIVGLLGVKGVLRCTGFTKDSNSDLITELQCVLENEDTMPGKKLERPKAWIHWVAEYKPSGSPIRIAEVRLFDRLFKSDNPGKPSSISASAGTETATNIQEEEEEAEEQPGIEAPAGSTPSSEKTRALEADLNPSSLHIVRDAFADLSFWSIMSNSVHEERIRLEKAKLARIEAKQAEADSESNAWNGDDYEAGDEKMWDVEPQVGKECVRFQGMRTAYFALDKDSEIASLQQLVTTPLEPSGSHAMVHLAIAPTDKIILNRIVGLKEDAGKK